MRERLRRLLPGAWLGVLLGVALLATPAPFAVLDRPTAGRVVQWIFAREAPASLVIAVLVLMLERRRALEAWQSGVARSQFSLAMVGALVALACTIVGWYVLQPMMEAAKLAPAGGGGPTFGQLHAVSLGLFGIKILAVAALAWGATREPPDTGPADSGRISPTVSS